MNDDDDLAIQPDNHRGHRLCWYLVDHAERLVAIAEIAATFSAEETDEPAKILLTDAWGEQKRIDLAWFLRHKSHELITVVDYGDRFERKP